MSGRLHLPGGSGGVWYEKDAVFGRVVHRPTGPWTSAVHELLRYLRQAGLAGVPDVVGIDSDGAEMLTFLPGRSLAPDDEEPSDALLESAAGWLRRFHDAVAGFRPDGPRVWRQTAADLAPGQIVCHNDPGTYNWIVDGDAFVGLVDWDQAGPGHPLDDVAFLCWTGVPLFREIQATDAARRVALVARAYGGVDTSALLDAAADRMTRASDRIAQGIERGDPGMLSLQQNGEPARTRARVEAFLERLPAIRAELTG
jgi:aminoglycoside phosphotransferase